MAHDDRFFTLVCCAALLITGSIFFWTHRGSLRFEVGTPAGTTTGTDQATATPIAPQPCNTVDAGSIHQRAAGTGPSAVEAAFDPAIDQGAAQTAFKSPGGPTPDQVIGLVEAIIQLKAPILEGWGLPALGDVLVRRDRDGRLVVAAGTHRRYERVRDAITALDGPTVAAACDVMERRCAMGAPGAGLLQAKVVEALDLLLAPELADVELDMVSRGSYWGFADPGLDELAPAQKHMLLMGLDNQRIVRQALEEIRHYLAGPPGVASPDPESPGESGVLIARRDQAADRLQLQITEP